MKGQRSDKANQEDFMTRKTLVRIVVAAAIVAMLGGASLIIAHNSQGSAPGTPFGFLH